MDNAGVQFFQYQGQGQGVKHIFFKKINIKIGMLRILDTNVK